MRRLMLISLGLTCLLWGLVAVALVIPTPAGDVLVARGGKMRLLLDAHRQLAHIRSLPPGTDQMRLVDGALLIEVGADLAYLDAYTHAVTRITDSPNNKHLLDATPDGQHIVYSTVYTDGYRITRQSGGEETLVSSSPFDLRAEVSMDGRYVAYTNGDQMFRTFLHVRDIERGETQVLGSGTVISFEWSPVGNRLAYYINNGDTETMSVMTPGGEPTLLGENLLPGRWSPDGTRLAYVARRPGGMPTDLLLWDGAETTRLSALEAPLLRVDWSPDGEQILLLSYDRQRGTALHVVDEVSDTVVLTPRGGFQTTAFWSPDGQRIVYRRSQPADRNPGLYEIRLSDGRVRTLVHADVVPLGWLGP